MERAAEHRHHEHEPAGYPAGYPPPGHPAESDAGPALAGPAADAGPADSQHAEPGNRHSNHIPRLNLIAATAATAAASQINVGRGIMLNVYVLFGSLNGF